MKDKNEGLKKATDGNEDMNQTAYVRLKQEVRDGKVRWRSQTARVL